MLDVHIGFMDEETKPVLEQLMRLNAGSSSAKVSDSKYSNMPSENPGVFRSVIDRLFLVNHDRPIYVIERDDILAGASLFQMVDNKYSLPWDCKVGVVLPDAKSKARLSVVVPGSERRRVDSGPVAQLVKGKGQHAAEALARSLGAAAGRTGLVRQVTLLWNTALKSKLASNTQMAYTVCAYNTKNKSADHRNPVIIVRAPEMGLQPELIRLHLQTIMLALNEFKRSDAPQGAANVYMYGAGGALGTGTQPGKLQNIMASLYVGAEVYAPSIAGQEPNTSLNSREEMTKALGQKWVGVIAFACPDSHIVLYNSEPVDTAREAMDLANREFKQGQGIATSIESCRKLAARLYPSYSISLTSSAFMGGDIKDAARKHGLTGDCNMEDYHVLRVIHEMKYNTRMPRLFNHGLARIDCDPPHIPKELFTDFKQWAKEASWTRQHYVEGILWGLLGVTYDAVRWEYAHWGFADKVKERYGEQKMRDYVYVLKDKDNHRVLCPFYTELACDLVETVATHPKGPKAVFGAAHEAVGSFGTLKQKAEAIKSAAAQSVRSEEGVTRLKKIIGEFVDAFGEILEGARLKEKGKDVWPIWARPGWSGAGWEEGSAWAVASVSAENPAGAIAKVWDEHFPDGKPNGNLDRALYKSTNMMALQLLAPDGGSQIVHAHKWGNVMDELKSKHKTEWGPKLANKDWKAEEQRLSDNANRTKQRAQAEMPQILAKILHGVLIQTLMAARQQGCRPIQSFDEGPPSVF